MVLVICYSAEGRTVARENEVVTARAIYMGKDERPGVMGLPYTLTAVMTTELYAFPSNS